MMTMHSRESEGRRLIAAGYSDQFVQMANDCSTWLFWHRQTEASQRVIVGSGTVFFLDAGQGPFGLTAFHVIEALQEAKSRFPTLGIQLGNTTLDPSASLRGEDPIRDLATFRVAERDISLLGKRPHIDPGRWPP